MIDLVQLRATIAAAPEGTAATVTRRFLEQVEREISEGRDAIAKLQRQVCMAEVITSLAEPARA